MEVNRKSCHLASLVVLIIFTAFPVKCLSAGDTYTPARERSENTQLKRYADDYDSFVGLMGKRRAATGLNIADHILADLLQQKHERVVLQHKRFCRRGVLNSPAVESRGDNPLCDGDVKYPCVSGSPLNLQSSSCHTPHSSPFQPEE